MNPNEITKYLIKALNQEREKIIIAGLKNKGHVFATRESFEAFAKAHCRIEFRGELTVFYAGGVPFLEILSSKTPLTISSDPLETTITVHEKYRFL